jgi:hypothetical protein
MLYITPGLGPSAIAVITAMAEGPFSADLFSVPAVPAGALNRSALNKQHHCELKMSVQAVILHKTRHT